MQEKTEYTYVDGVFTFPGDLYQLRVSKVTRDRFNRVFATVELKTKDGEAYLAMDRGDLATGRFRSQVANQAASRNSGDPLAIENFLLDASLALMADPEVAPAASAPAFQTLDSFMRTDTPTRPPVVRELIERGELISAASKPKVGKTLMLCNMALAVACGTDWLGRSTAKGKVFMFQLEDSTRTLKRRFASMTGGSWPANFELHLDPFKLSVENFDATVATCAGASLIICDPIIQASDIQDWNAQSEVRNTYELWRRLARDTDAAVVVAAHHRKMAGDFGDQMAGSIQAQAAVDGIIELFRDSNLAKTERKVTFTGRDWADLEDEVISLDTDTLIWTPAGSYQEIQEMAKEGKAQEKAAKVLDALPTKTPGLTYAELEKKTGMGRDPIRRAIEALGDKVRQTGKAKSPTDPLKFSRKA